MAEDEAVLVCVYFRVERLPGDFYKPSCSRLGVISAVCNPLNPRCGCPYYKARLFKVGNVGGADVFKRVVSALITASLRKLIQELEVMLDG
ncbi:MAG: hypothetical protein QXQ47_06790 [Candidatus Bathyarchaeia archaeon]